MSEAKLVRERPQTRLANRLEKVVGLQPLVERAQTPESKTPRPTGVPEGVVTRLIRWVPTETIVLYVAFIALFDPLVPKKGESDLCTAAGGFGVRWIGFAGFLALTVLIVLLVHTAKVRRTEEPFRWPWFEMVVAPIAFSAWALALPDTPLHSICGYGAEIGGFLVLAITVAIGLFADAFGKQPNH